MRKRIIPFAAGALTMLLMLLVLSKLHSVIERKEQELIQAEYISTIEKEDCFLCGTHRKAGYTYWGEDNVGILNLNTLELIRIEINRYDDFGNCINSQAGYMSTTGIADKKTGSSVSAFVFPDEGFARLQVFDMQYEIDRQIMEDNFCQSCLDSVNELSYLGVVAEYAVISFQEQTIHPLTQSLPWFSAGNYGVDCEFGDGIKLLVHYLNNNK